MDLAEQIVYDNRDILVKMNKDQLIEGQNTLGGKIKPSYTSTDYAVMKSKMNNLAGFSTPDLLLTGEFYRGMEAIVESGEWFITSDDEKTPFLTDKYEDIFGLTEQSENSVKPLFTELLVRKHATIFS